VGERLCEKCNDTEVPRIDQNQMAVSVDCYSSGLPLPAPPKQTQRAEAAGEKYRGQFYCETADEIT
jgi:hypothetical protein